MEIYLPAGRLLFIFVGQWHLIHDSIVIRNSVGFKVHCRVGCEQCFGQSLGLRGTGRLIVSGEGEPLDQGNIRSPLMPVQNIGRVFTAVFLRIILSDRKFLLTLGRLFDHCPWPRQTPRLF